MSKKSRTIGDGTEPKVLSDEFLLAKQYFDLREYARCSHLLKNAISRSKLLANDPLILFLCYYAEYLHILVMNSSAELVHEPAPDPQLTRQEAQEPPMNKNGDKWRDLVQVLKCLSQRTQEPYLMYLYAVVLVRNDQKQRAIQVLVKCLNANDMLWCAWQELASQMTHWHAVEQATKQLPAGQMRQFFLIHCGVELGPQSDTGAGYQSEQLHAMISDLQQVFPYSTWLESQRASLYYHERAFDEAAETFRTLQQLDPHDMQLTITYSNILFVQDDAPQLSALAQQMVTRVDPQCMRAETCYVLGNYHSLKGQNDRAIEMFRRCIQLSGGSGTNGGGSVHLASAYTLMGHEYIEVRNTDAALESYRNAIQLLPHDYRAWYGLGQTYEMLQMPQYSLYYFQRAVELRPRDGRMWSALGAVYEQLGHYTNAIMSYKRSLMGKFGNEQQSPQDDVCTAQELQSLAKIAQLYDAADQDSFAYWRQLVDSVQCCQQVAERTGAVYELPAEVDLRQALTVVVAGMRRRGGGEEDAAAAEGYAQKLRGM